MDNTFSEETINPFELFLKNPGLDMLNSALPFVSDRMRKPLALCIKAMEINRIMHDFDREDVLSACGFERNTPNPEAMLRAMKMAGGKNAAPQIDQLLKMLNLLKAYQSFTEMLQNNPEMVSFITNMMNQNGSGPAQGDTQPSNPGTPPTPADILSQFAGKDTSDMMSLLSQMMKNAQ